MRLNTTSNLRLDAEGTVIQQVDQFTYLNLGTVVSTEDPTQKDIKNRLAKARSAFQRLRPIWKSKQYNRKTKIRLYNSNVKSVLLYGSECWRVTKTDMRALSSFHHSCLRQICKKRKPTRNDKFHMRPQRNTTETSQVARTCSRDASIHYNQDSP